MFREGQEYSILPSKPFYFNPQTKEFVVADQTTKLSLQNDYDELDPDPLAEGQTELDSIPLVLGLCDTLIQMPLMRRWLLILGDKKENVSQQIIEAMAQTYHELNPRVVLPKEHGRHKNRGFLNFSAVFDEYGKFHLHTFGNCACLGPDPHGYSISYKDTYSAYKNPDVPYPYCLHNADTIEQRLSLYVGAGTLAWLAQREAI